MPDFGAEPVVYTYQQAHWEYADLPVDVEASYVAAKVRNAYAGVLPGPGLVIDHYRGVRFQVIPTTDGRWSVRNLVTGIVTVPPAGIEGPTLREISPLNIRDACGINDQDREIAALKSRVAALESQLAERQQHVSVRCGGGPTL